MNVELVRKFLLDYLPAEAQIPVNEIFESLKKDPLLVLNNGLIFNQLEFFKSTDKRLSICAVNGVLCGFALGYAVQVRPDLEKALEQYISIAAKLRGENVIDFLQRKGK